MNNLNVEPRTIFCHDNLEILQGINSACVDLIYLDPPFNTKKIFSAPIGTSAEGAEFSDIFREEDVKDEWVDSIRFESPELHDYLKGVKSFSNKYNYCYLVYMAIRLIECHRLLKDTGSLYLHCDPTMSHYLKIVLDCIFGEKNFRNEVVWCYSRPSAPNQKQLSRVHDIIFWYSKGNTWTFNPESIRQPYASSSLNRQGYSAKASKVAEGVVELNDNGKFPESWIYIPPLKGNSRESTGYPTQKPLALLERIIQASSNAGDVVLDPFCGCATTCIAAEKLDRQWVGIDISHKAYELVKNRLDNEVPADMFRPEPHFSTQVPKLTEDGIDAFGQGFVYVIANSSWEGMYKVGIAKDVKRRLNSYQTSDPYRAYELEYQLQTPHFKAIEKHIHKNFNGDYEWVEGELEEIKNTIKEQAESYNESTLKVNI